MCDIPGLACLYRNKDKLQSNNDCGCPVACEDVYYKAVHINTPTRDKNLNNQLGRGSRVLVKLNSLPYLRVRRHAMRDMLSFVAPMAHCSVAQCSLPCRGAAPPPTCPDILPQCASGCACMADCEQQAIVCFETKHCVLRKKYFARTMKHRTV